MNKRLKDLSELAAKANDTLTSQHPEVNTIMGITDKTLRKQGINADAITIDCLALDKKIAILPHDDKPDIVAIALGNRAGDIFSSSEYELAKLTETAVVDIMKTNFIS